MPKAKLVTRSASTSSVTTDSIPKGSGLTNAELDSNFLNLRDQSIAITDGSNSSDVTAGQTITVTGTGGISVSQSNRTVTVDASSITAAADIVTDTSPQLGADLDAQSNKITSLGTPTNNTDAVTKQYVDRGKELVTSVSPGATLSADRNTAAIYKVNLTQSTTVNSISNFDEGKTMSFVFRQDATGGRSVTWTNTIKWVGGSSALSTGGNDIDFVTLVNDGTDILGAINKDYN